MQESSNQPAMATNEQRALIDNLRAERRQARPSTHSLTYQQARAIIDNLTAQPMTLKKCLLTLAAEDARIRVSASDRLHWLIGERYHLTPAAMLALIEPYNIVERTAVFYRDPGGLRYVYVNNPDNEQCLLFHVEEPAL